MHVMQQSYRTGETLLHNYVVDFVKCINYYTDEVFELVLFIIRLTIRHCFTAKDLALECIRELKQEYITINKEPPGPPCPHSQRTRSYLYSSPITGNSYLQNRRYPLSRVLVPIGNYKKDPRSGVFSSCRPCRV